MIKNKYTRLYLLLLTTILMMGGTYASQNATILTYISKLQIIDTNLPNVSNQKGYIGAILGEIFNGSGKIKSDYLDFSGVTLTGTFVAPVTSVAGKTGIVTLAKGDVGLTNVDNTSDIAKNVLSATKLTTARNIAGISFNGTVDIAIPFANLASKPTTVSGYGISDFISSNSTTPINPNNTTVNGIYYANSLSLFGQVDGGLFNQAYNSSWQGQIYQDYRTGQIALRGKNNGIWTSWRQVWDNLNDGTSSGLDSDLLDGLHSTSFLRTVSDGSYYGIVDAAGSSSNWIRTTTNGLIPATSGGASSLGTSSRPFLSVYGNTIYEGGTALAGKYLGISSSTANELYNNGWFRSNGNVGWYSQTYGGGLRMTDTSWIRTYNAKSIRTEGGLLGSNGGLTVGYGGISPSAGGAIISGNVGIGTYNPQAKLDVNGLIRGNDPYGSHGNALINQDGRIGRMNIGNGYIEVLLDGTAYGITVWASDERYKNNIKDSSYNALDDIEKMKFKSFYHKIEHKNWDLGFIAQDLQKINKNYVNEMSDGYLNPDIPHLLVTSLKANQELKTLINEQQKQIDELKRQIEKFKK